MAKIISLFSGVGGIELPFVENGHEVVFANDFEEKATITYNLNFKEKALCADITKVDVNAIPNGDIFSCRISQFPQ